MKFSQLRHTDLSTFLERNGSCDDDLWFFVHIPKTAGSSTVEALNRDLHPYENIHVDYTDPSPHNEKLRMVVSRFIEQHTEQPFRSASGHLPFEYYKTLTTAFPNTRSFTFLRNPVDRVISDFRYQRTTMHPPHQKFIKDFPTIESYVETTSSQNKMSRFLSDIHDATPDPEIVETILDEFDFIGTLDMYDMCYHCITQMALGEGQLPQFHERKTPDEPQTQVERSPRLIKLIQQYNKLDVLLYDTVRDILRKHRDTWRQGQGRA